MANPIIGELTTEVSETVGVMQSATVLIEGIGARVQAAVDAAIANGATAEELAPVSQLVADLDTTGNALAAAVAANQGPSASRK